MPSNDADGNIPTDNLEDHSIFRRPVRTYVIRAFLLSIERLILQIFLTTQILLQWKLDLEWDTLLLRLRRTIRT